MSRLFGIRILGVLALLAACGPDATEAEAPCDALATCCTQLNDTSESLCLQVVTIGNAAVCTTQLESYTSANSCKGAATGSGSGTGTSTGVVPTETCVTLASCCGQLADASSKSECVEVVSAGNDTACATAQTDYEGASLCVVGTTVSTGTASSTVVSSAGSSGTGTGTGSSGSVACAELASCCSSMANVADESDCYNLYTEAMGDGSSCASDLMLFPSCGSTGSGTGSATVTTSSGTGTGTGSVGQNCTMLGTCCLSLPSTYESQCADVVGAGNDSSCASSLAQFEESGYCGAVGSGSGTATATDTGSGTGTATGTSGPYCSLLASCCATLSGSDATSCTAVVALGDETTCASELEATAGGACL